MSFDPTAHGKRVSYWTDGSKVWAAGESAAKADIAGKTLYPISIQAAPVSYDETYGQLIYFDNFSARPTLPILPISSSPTSSMPQSRPLTASQR